jgi:hypothetical protein
MSHKEVACKYFECWFGVLQVWLATMQIHFTNGTKELLLTFSWCVILHNMILEDECDDDVKVIEPNVEIQFWKWLFFATFGQGTKAIENSNMYFETTQWPWSTLVAIESSSLKKFNNVIQFYGEIVFYSKSPVTFQLLFCCVSTIVLIDWRWIWI